MANPPTFKDQHHGRVYRYYSPYRPMPPSVLPSGTTYLIEPGRDPRVVETAEPLPDDFIRQAELQLVAVEEV